MTLMPIMSPVQSALFLGAWVSPDNIKGPDYDFTSISFDAGDLLVAVVTGVNADSAAAPSGFSQVYFMDNGTDRSVKVFTKVATGDESNVANPEDKTNVATAAVRWGVFGVGVGADQSTNPPVVANNAGDVVFIVMGSGDDQGAVTAPSGYTLVGSEYSSVGVADSFISFAYKASAPFSEDPGAFGGASNTSEVGVATFTITRA